MNLLNKLFGGKSKPQLSISTQTAQPPTQPELDSCRTKQWLEKENAGTRIETVERHRAWGMSNLVAGAPTVIAIFKAKEQSTEAMLELPFVGIAADSKKMICKEPLDFGVFPWQPYNDYNGEYKWAAMLSGKHLTIEAYELAQKLFNDNSGHSVADIKPAEPSAQNAAKPDLGRVAFSRERKEKSTIGSSICTYQHYAAPDKATAMEWLAQQPVPKQLEYLVVETPEGVFSRDCMGMF